jgi:hypothetical protein
LFSAFGKLKGEKVEVQLTCLADSFEILIDALAISDRKKSAISYTEVWNNPTLFLIPLLLTICSLFSSDC